MVSLIERCQNVLAGAVLALLVASVILVPQNRALGDLADDRGGGIVGICAGNATCN